MPEKPLTNSLAEETEKFTPKTIDSILVERQPTGFAQLDQLLGGGLVSGLYALGAKPGLGKSTFALQLACNIAHQGRPVLFFSMEMSKTWLAAKVLSSQIFADLRKGTLPHEPSSPISANDLLSRPKWHEKGFTATDIALIDQAREEVRATTRNLFIFVADKDLSSAEDIGRKVEGFLRKYPGVPPVVIVDYLQIIHPDNKTSYPSDKQKVDATVKIFSELREENRLPLILISSVNRKSYEHKGNEEQGVSMDSFKESGIIEFSADVILGMQLSAIRTGKFDNQTEMAKVPRKIDIAVLKQRYGSNGAFVRFNYFTHNDYFEELSVDTEMARFLEDHSDLKERIFQ